MKGRKGLFVFLFLMILQPCAIGTLFYRAYCEDAVVYVTPNGKKYHRKECRTLKKTEDLIPMSKAEAVEAGYTPCKICNP